MNLQDIIFKLQQFWAKQGCIVVQPWDVEKGAGTFNSATYLRSLGPEPWRVAYVEPSRRPTDGRYGENPNRLERHHQFQVLLKPSPGDVQELYLRSLQAIGIDPMIHDIRFVEDNWESPTLGAWGLGWEVWCDGMEITQFTYFQQCGGFDLEPIPVELTYGLERIAMILQNAESVYDLRWGGNLTYGDIRHAEEVQWSAHNFEQADIDLHLTWFDSHANECNRLCDAGLVIPAYDYCLRCSHLFNILDARGAIGVTERQAYILRVRQLSKRCAEGYLAHRESLGFPLDRDEGPRTVRMFAPSGDGDTGPRRRMADVEPFLLEIGTEEIPARLAPKAAKELSQLITSQLDEWGITNVTGVHADCTPRRLVVGIDAVAVRQKDSEEVAKGPPVRIAFNDDGSPTRAGAAFEEQLGEDDEVFREETPKGEYLMVRRKKAGRPLADLLAEELPKLLSRLHWGKPMRWGRQDTAFVRPVHWILCTLGGQVVSFRFAGVSSGVESWGHRFHSNVPFEASSWSELEAGLEKHNVLLSSARRRAHIEAEVADVAASVGGRPADDPALLDEVTHLCEWPIAILGSYEEESLSLPRQVIVTPMRVHQRYFPIQDRNGNLLPHFAVISNTDVRDHEIVSDGYARVLRARLADARYFYENDLKQPLEESLPSLEKRIWLAELGSVREKVDRMVTLVAHLGGDESAQQTALLCKADLASAMVGEFPELQGQMGCIYAREQGLSSDISVGILESYLPRFAGDELPSSQAGAFASVSDRIDSIVGCFGIGLKPTGSKDPYALRRQCLGVIRILAESTADVPRDLTAWIDGALSGYGDKIADHETCRNDVLAFFADRTRYLLREQLPVDVVDAVVSAGAARPKDVFGKIDALVTLRNDGELEPILTTFKRVANITSEHEAGQSYDDSLLSEPAEEALTSAFQTVSEEVLAGVDAHDFGRVVAQMAALRPLVDTFFDDILVMAEEKSLRDSRLGLLCAIRDLFGQFANFGQIQER